MVAYQPICKASEIPEGAARMFLLGEQAIGIFHVAGEFFALANACPHKGASLAHSDITGDVVSCHVHHWRFSLRDGEYLDENKPEYNVQTFPVRIVDGEVYVAIAPPKR